MRPRAAPAGSHPISIPWRVLLAKVFRYVLTLSSIANIFYTNLESEAISYSPEIVGESRSARGRNRAVCVAAVGLPTFTREDWLFC